MKRLKLLFFHCCLGFTFYDDTNIGSSDICFFFNCIYLTYCSNHSIHSEAVIWLYECAIRIKQPVSRERLFWFPKLNILRTWCVIYVNCQGLLHSSFSPVTTQHFALPRQQFHNIFPDGNLKWTSLNHYARAMHYLTLLCATCKQLLVQSELLWRRSPIFR